MSEKNWRTVELYLESRAAGLPAGFSRDRLLRHNLSIVDSIYRGHERRALAEELAVIMAGH